MRKPILFLIVISIFIAACTQNQNVACTMDAKICLDGTAVGRIPPNCEFQECPKVDENQGKDCDYSKAEPQYIGKSVDECSRIKFACIRGREYFQDECGCGCKLKNESICDYEDLNKEYVSKDLDVCILLNY